MVFASFAYPFPQGSPSTLLFGLGFGTSAVAAGWLFQQAQRERVVGAVAVALTGFCVAWVWYGWQAQVQPVVKTGEQIVQGVVVQAERSTDGQQLTVKRANGGRILVFAPLYPRLQYGDVLQASCDVRKAEPFNGFAYDRYLATKHIYHTCFLYESPIVTQRGQGNPVLFGLSRAHDAVVDRVEQLYGEPHAALLSGLLLGDQRFSDQWEKQFQATGTTHIVAASGYNVTVVLFLLFGLLVYLRVRRQHAFVVLLVGVTAYVVLAGADAAIVRAGIMGALVLTSKQLGRRSSMTNILLLAAVVMLVVEPRLLRDDVGFQLSALATAGLIYFAPTVEKWFHFVPTTMTLRESLSATVAATIATLPVILFNFGQFSLLSPLANILILPVLPFAMAFGAISLLISLVSLPFAAVTTGPAWALLSYVLWVIESLADLPLSSLTL